MRIGIDARELCGRSTGAGRYLSGLLAQWSANEKARPHDFVLYAPEPLGVAYDVHRFPTRIVPGSSGSWWEQVRLPSVAARDRLDVFFAPAYTAPLFLRVPTVVAIHDLSFAAHPEWFSTREGIRRRLLSRRAASQARAVVTISQFSCGELIERYGLSPSRVHVIPPGIMPRAWSTMADRSRPRVLFVGSIFNRRHVPDLIRAFMPIARAHDAATLDIVGANRTHPRQDIAEVIATADVVGRVTWRQYVSDEELGRLYAQARAFAFLSEYEGFGLTPLEALAASVPPVLLDTEVAHESCGNAALYVPLGNLAATIRALEQLLFDETIRENLLAEAPRVLAKYSWPVAARETLAVIEGAA